MKQVLRIAALLFALTLLLCSCAQRASYDENGICRVIDGKVPEDVEQYIREPSYEGGFTSFEDFKEVNSDLKNLIVRARLCSAESISSKDTPLAYTIAEMEILEIYIQEGELFQEYHVGDSIDILLSYTFVPEKGKAVFQPCQTIGFYYLERDKYDSCIAYSVAFHYVTAEDKYLLYIDDMVTTGILAEEYTITNYECSTPIISKENATKLFIPNITWKIDEARYEEMKQTPKYVDREKRNGEIFKGYYNYVYFDILDQYIFGEK